MRTGSRSRRRSVPTAAALIFAALSCSSCGHDEAASDAELQSALSGSLPTTRSESTEVAPDPGERTRPALPTADDLAGDSQAGQQFDATTQRFFGGRFGDLPVPARWTANETITTEDGRITHRRGARLFRPGDVTEGDLVSFSARLANSGSTPLRIERVEGECECVEALCFRLEGDSRGAPLLPGQDVAPGEEFEVQVHLDTTDRFGQLQLEGILDYRGAKAPLKFGVLANIRPVYVIEPAEALVPKSVLLGDEYSVEARITSPVAPLFKLVLEKKRLPPYLKLDVEPIEPNADGYARAWLARYRVLAEAPDAAGLETHPVVFEVVAPPPPGEELSFSLLRTVGIGHRSQLPVEALQVDGQGGAMFDFGRVAPGSTVERRLRLRVNDRDFALPEEIAVVARGTYTIGAHVLPETAIATRVETLANGAREVVATFTVPADLKGPVRGQLIVEIGHPRQNGVLTTFTALVR